MKQWDSLLRIFSTRLAGDVKRGHGVSPFFTFCVAQTASGHILVCSMPLFIIFLLLAATWHICSDFACAGSLMRSM